jgi:putative redox protein
MAHVTVISDFHFAQQIVAGHHRTTSDEPSANGGSDTGPSPTELLLGSLGSCTSITLRMYAGRKGWELGKITVGLRYSPASDGRKAHIERRLSFAKPVTEEQSSRLVEIANKTPVTLVLLAGVSIDTSITAHHATAA